MNGPNYERYVCIVYLPKLREICLYSVSYYKRYACVVYLITRDMLV